VIHSSNMWRDSKEPDPIGQILRLLQKTSCSTGYIVTLPRNTLTKLVSRDGPGAMSKSEIQSWISSSNIVTSPDDSGDGVSWQRDNVLNDWPRAIEFAQARLLTSKTRIRIQFLQEELLSLAKHGGT
jgi:hypothetical protein